jgi:Predicted integral membrane protein (DUF2269)
MEALVPWLLFLHVLGAIVAFGPTFAFATVASAGRAEPQHANFGTRLSHTISSRFVYPVGITLPITGLAMIGILKINPLERTHWWLGIAIVLYTVAYGYSFFVQRKLVERVIELTSAPPPPGASGPPPEVPALGKRIGQGGMVMGVLLVLIVLLMVVKPQF